MATVVALGIGLAACGGGGGGDDDPVPLETSADSATGDTGLPACRDANRAVVFSVFGGATTGSAADVLTWADDPEAGPEARAGAAEVAGAYRDAGYQVIYIALAPSDTAIGDQPLADAITVWLGLNNFPIGEGARVWAPQGAGADPSVALIEELARVGAAGTEVDAGYAGDQETVYSLVAGGLPRDRVFKLGAGDIPSSTEVSSTPLPDDNLSAHVAEVRALDPICE